MPIAEGLALANTIPHDITPSDPCTSSTMSPAPLMNAPPAVAGPPTAVRLSTRTKTSKQTQCSPPPHAPSARASIMGGADGEGRSWGRVNGVIRTRMSMGQKKGGGKRRASEFLRPSNRAEPVANG